MHVVAPLSLWNEVVLTAESVANCLYLANKSCIPCCFLSTNSCSYPYCNYFQEKHSKYDSQSTILLLTTDKSLISCLPVVTCSLRLSNTERWDAVHLFTQVVSVYVLFQSCTVLGSTQIKCTFRCRVSTGGWMIEEEMRCLLLRTLKLMRPFASSEGDLKNSEMLSEWHNHCLTADQSQSSSQLSSTLFRLQSSQIPSAHVLKFLLCCVWARWENATQSDSVRFVEYWVDVLCQMVRQPWWSKKVFSWGRIK